MGILDPSPQAYKQRRGTYFYYNRAAIGIACAQATAMRIDTPTSMISNTRHLDYSTVLPTNSYLYSRGNSS
jgi:hypothetical protein